MRVGRNVIGAACDLALAGILGTAGVLKLMSPETSAAALSVALDCEYGGARRLVIGGSVIEVLGASCLLLWRKSRFVSLLAIGLVCTVLLIRLSVLDSGQPCGCFGSFSLHRATERAAMSVLIAAAIGRAVLSYRTGR